MKKLLFSLGLLFLGLCALFLGRAINQIDEKHHLAFARTAFPECGGYEVISYRATPSIAKIRMDCGEPTIVSIWCENGLLDTGQRITCDLLD